jgi:hypothetical protein
LSSAFHLALLRRWKLAFVTRVWSIEELRDLLPEIHKIGANR